MSEFEFLSIMQYRYSIRPSLLPYLLYRLIFVLSLTGRDRENCILIFMLHECGWGDQSSI